MPDIMMPSVSGVDGGLFDAVLRMIQAAWIDAKKQENRPAKMRSMVGGSRNTG